MERSSADIHHGDGGGIEATGITKAFGEVRALDDVDIRVRRGEIVALLGENGAGKSTLLRILGTTLLANSGRIRIEGLDIEKSARHVREVTGLVLGEERSWYWRLSGSENLQFFARLHGHRRREALAEASRLIELTGLQSASERRVEGYSSGMRARLALARALLGDPRVLLLDEPTRALDPLAAAGFRAQMESLAKDGRAVLWATHDLHEAAALADRVIVLHRGQIAATFDGGISPGDLERALLAVIR